MPLKDDLEKEVTKIFRDTWTKRDGQVVPESEDITLGNDAVLIDGTVLYADIAASTEMVDGFNPHFAAEVYKAFLLCAAKIIRSESGVITAYDGDRVMAVFIGDSKNTTAARVALKIHFAVRNIVNPKIQAQYNNSFILRHVVGIDSSSLWIARTGVRGANDLVWVGHSANHAAKLSSLNNYYVTNISEQVYSKLDRSSKIGSDGLDMWSPSYTDYPGKLIYRSNYFWAI